MPLVALKASICWLGHLPLKKTLMFKKFPVLNMATMRYKLEFKIYQLYSSHWRFLWGWKKTTTCCNLEFENWPPWYSDWRYNLDLFGSITSSAVPLSLPTFNSCLPKHGNHVFTKYIKFGSPDFLINMKILTFMG